MIHLQYDSDNLPYEKVGKNEPVCIADEVPFEIPESWEWIRLGSLGDWGSGATPSRSIPEYYDGDIPWLKTGDLNDGYIEFIPENISRLALEKTSVRMNPTGSVLIAMYGATIGKVGILTFPATTNQACCACFPIEIYNEYLFYFLMSQKVAFVKQGEGGAQPNISKEKIVATLMPLPPLAEQYRIVDKIKELLPYVERYGEAHLAVNSLNAAFPDLLKKSILQEAVQGKLVPQDPADEPASVLLKRIRAEKEQLIKAGKIKKDKHESIIFRRDNSHYEKRGSKEACIDDEIPFEIPESWTWCRLNELCVKIGAGSTPTGGKAVYVSNGIKFIRSQNVYNDGLRLTDIAYITEETNLKKSGSIVRAKDILLNITGGSIGRCAIVPDNFDIANVNQHVMIIRLVDPVIRQWMHAILISDYIQNLIMDVQVGVSREGLSATKLMNFLIPIPPIREQKQILEFYATISNRLSGL